MKAFVGLAALLIFVGRMFITPRLASIPSVEGGYEAFAHLFVGFLILVPFYDRKQIIGPTKTYGWIGWLLALWEGGWFIAQKIGPWVIAA